MLCVCVYVFALCDTQMEHFPCAMWSNDEKKEYDGKATKQRTWRGGKREKRQTTVNRRLWLQVQSDYIRIYISTLIYVSASHFSSSRALSGRRRIFFRIQFFILLNDFGSHFFSSLSVVHLFVYSFSLCVSRAVLKLNNPLSQSHHSTHMQIKRKYNENTFFFRIRQKKCTTFD